MKDCITHFEQFFSKTSITVGAPVGGGAIGIIGIIEKMVPLLTVISILIGISLGIMSYLLKRKLINRQLKDIEMHPHEHDYIPGDNDEIPVKQNSKFVYVKKLHTDES